MTLRSRSRPRGFSLIELLAVLVVIAVLAAVFLDRILWYQERAEKVSMEATVGVLRGALHLQAVRRLVAPGAPELRPLADENPMTWLATRPENYVGPRTAEAAGNVPVGHWYFDVSDRSLVYRLRHHRYFDASASGPAEVRFRTVVDYGAVDAGTVAVLRSLDIRPVRDYRWFPEGE